MYMIVFAMIILSILGYFSQVYMMQSTEARRNQPGIAEVMRAWHDAAVGTAMNAVTDDCFNAVLGGTPYEIKFQKNGDKFDTAEVCGIQYSFTDNACIKKRCKSIDDPALPPEVGKINWDEWVITNRPCVIPLSLDTQPPYRFRSIFFKSEDKLPDEGEAVVNTNLATWLEPPPAHDPYQGTFVCFDGSAPPCVGNQQIPYDFYRLYDNMRKSMYASSYAFGIASTDGTNGKRVLKTIHNQIEGMNCDPVTNMCAPDINGVIQYTLPSIITDSSFVMINAVACSACNSKSWKEEEGILCE
ncbi:MAG: hypothetical protein FWE93_04015 [Alphaproteobacteria bacterium]|nr:hypothetical protein [Alphaproteobacteria bacterium]